MLSLLTVSNKPDAEGQLNTGNKVTNDVKLMVKVCTLHSRSHLKCMKSNPKHRLAGLSESMYLRQCISMCEI
jgi:hypothetical protein